MSTTTPAPAAPELPAIDVKAQLDLALMHARSAQRSFLLYGSTVSQNGLESLMGCINTIEYTLAQLDPTFVPQAEAMRVRVVAERDEDDAPKGYVASRQHRRTRSRRAP